MGEVSVTIMMGEMSTYRTHMHVLHPGECKRMRARCSQADGQMRMLACNERKMDLAVNGEAEAARVIPVRA